MKTGKLTIFTSYTPGAGKTHFMVEKAMERFAEGEKVYFAFLNGSHRSIKNIIEANGFKRNFAKKYSVKDILEYKPALVVLDEMGMHGINVDEDTFIYEDIKKLLSQGIDVYTSVNLKKFRTANPHFKKITGIGIKKAVPDIFLEIAETIYFIDRAPQLMVEDFECNNLFGKKYRNSKIMKKNFQIDTLIEYRNISYKLLEKYNSKVKIVVRNN